jgi:hypothetical protein
MNGKQKVAVIVGAGLGAAVVGLVILGVKWVGAQYDVTHPSARVAQKLAKLRRRIKPE